MQHWILCLLVAVVAVMAWPGDYSQQADRLSDSDGQWTGDGGQPVRSGDRGNTFVSNRKFRKPMSNSIRRLSRRSSAPYRVCVTTRSTKYKIKGCGTDNNVFIKLGNSAGNIDTYNKLDEPDIDNFEMDDVDCFEITDTAMGSVEKIWIRSVGDDLWCLGTVNVSPLGDNSNHYYRCTCNMELEGNNLVHCPCVFSW